MITALGLVERDGFVAVLGAALGLASVVVTAAVVAMLLLGVHAVPH